MHIFLQQNIVPSGVGSGGGKGPPVSVFQFKYFEFIWMPDLV